MVAVELGNVKNLKRIIRNNQRWNSARWISIIDKKGRAPLHLSALHGHRRVTRFIIDELYESIPDKDLRKDYVNVVDKKGRTALFHAATIGNEFVLRSLIEIGVEMDTATNRSHAAPGSTAIMVCAEKGHAECFDILLDLGADLLAKRIDGADAFYLAAMNGHTEVVGSIVNTEHMRILCHDIIDKPTYRGRTPLFTAAFHGHIDVVKLLFERGANLNHQDMDDFSPLILASYEGHLKLVKWLLRNGADPSKKDKFGDTALKSSDICGHKEVYKFILQWKDSDFKGDIYKEWSDKDESKNTVETISSSAKSKISFAKSNTMHFF